MRKHVFVLFLFQEDFEHPNISDLEGEGGAGEPAVTSQPQPAPMGTSTNPFVAMPPPPANESTSLNPQDKVSYTPGLFFEWPKTVWSYKLLKILQK